MLVAAENIVFFVVVFSFFFYLNWFQVAILSHFSSLLLQYKCSWPQPPFIYNGYFNDNIHLVNTEIEERRNASGDPQPLSIHLFGWCVRIEVKKIIMSLVRECEICTWNGFLPFVPFIFHSVIRKHIITVVVTRTPHMKHEHIIFIFIYLYFFFWSFDDCNYSSSLQSKHSYKSNDKPDLQKIIIAIIEIKCEMNRNKNHPCSEHTKW